MRAIVYIHKDKDQWIVGVQLDWFGLDKKSVESDLSTNWATNTALDPSNF